MPIWLSATLQILGVVGVIGTLGLIWWQTRMDHEQRRREATMSFIAGMSTYRLLDYELSPSENGRPLPLSEVDVATLMADKATSGKAFELVSQIENFSAGVHSGVFDLEVVNATKGGYMLEFFDRWKVYMETVIPSSQYPIRRYDQVEWLVKELATKRELPSPRMLKRPTKSAHGRLDA